MDFLFIAISQKLIVIIGGLTNANPRDSRVAEAREGKKPDSPSPVVWRWKSGFLLKNYRIVITAEFTCIERIHK